MSHNSDENDPWKALRQKIAEAENATKCASCDREDDLKATHLIEGGDLGGLYLLIPLCKICRIKWFCSAEFRTDLVTRYPEAREYMTF